MNRIESVNSSWVSKIILINIIIYLIQLFFSGNVVLETVNNNGTIVPLQHSVVEYYFSITSYLVFEKGYIWQIFSYMFLHGSILHIMFNMFMLFMFGMPLEIAWGGKKFLFYYLFTGVGAGITILISNWIIGGSNIYTPTLGASGAIFALFFAFGKLFPDTEIRFFPLFFIPIKAKYAVFIFGGIEIVMLIVSGGRGPISNVGHLGGLVFGIIYFLITRRHNITFQTKIFKAKLEKKLNKEQAPEAEKSDSINFLLFILEKIKTEGIASLSDDEYQKLRYYFIMLDDLINKELPIEINYEANLIAKLSPSERRYLEARILQEIKKLL